VLEAGTGSGSLTHALARAVAPHGRVASFEFHPARAAEATDELRRHGLLPNIASVTLRDVEAEGFPAEAEGGGEGKEEEGGFFVADGAADAVFLDLPGPWRVVPAAARALRPGGRFCGFSPCMEQVQRTAAALDARGFRDVRTVEVLLRAYDVHTVVTLPAVEEGGGGRGGGGAAAAAAAGNDGGKASPAAAAATAAAAGGEGAGGTGGSSAARLARKRARTAEDKEEEEEEEQADDGAGTEAAAAAAAAKQQPPPLQNRRVQCWPQADARGHTGYLTFATKYLSAVLVADGDDDVVEDEDDLEDEDEDEDEEELEGEDGGEAGAGKKDHGGGD
jgi:precorrin-6B methylase 2